MPAPMMMPTPLAVISSRPSERRSFVRLGGRATSAGPLRLHLPLERLAADARAAGLADEGVRDVRAHDAPMNRRARWLSPRGSDAAQGESDGNRQHEAWREPDHRLRHASQEQPARSRTPVRTDHDDPRLPVSRIAY